MTPPSVSATPTPTSNLSQNTALQLNLVQQGLTATYTAQDMDADSSQPGGSLLATLRRAAEARRFAAGTTACVNNEIETTTVVSSTVEDVSVETYYDSACTQLHVLGQFVVTLTSATSATETGSYTSYTQAGVVFEYQGPVTITFGGIGTNAEYFSTSSSVALNSLAPPYGSEGFGCAYASASLTCSFAAVEHLGTINADEGQALTLTAALTQSGSSATAAISGTGSNYAAVLDALSVVPAGTASWSVSGGAPNLTVSLNAGVSYASAAVLGSETLTITDSADEATLQTSYNAATQSIGGLLTPIGSGVPAATFSVSATTGAGSVTYGNGLMAQIVNWVIEA